MRIRSNFYSRIIPSIVLLKESGQEHHSKKLNLSTGRQTCFTAMMMKCGSMFPLATYAIRTSSSAQVVSLQLPAANFPEFMHRHRHLVRPKRQANTVKTPQL